MVNRMVFALTLSMLLTACAGLEKQQVTGSMYHIDELWGIENPDQGLKIFVQDTKEEVQKK